MRPFSLAERGEAWGEKHYRLVGIAWLCEKSVKR